jgi:predicted ABC-type ATPase
MYLNADDIAARLGLSVGESARTADAVRGALLDSGESFITETVFSDPVGAKLQFMKDAIAKDYDVTLIYFGLDSSDLSEARVIQRVASGGHDVPSERLPRRYAQSLINLGAATDFVPDIRVFDNSNSEDPFRYLLEIRDGLRRDQVTPLPKWLAGALARTV